MPLHRLGVYRVLGDFLSFKTTNCLESVNAVVEERCAKVDAWGGGSPPDPASLVRHAIDEATPPSAPAVAPLGAAIVEPRAS